MNSFPVMIGHNDEAILEASHPTQTIKVREVMKPVEVLPGEASLAEAARVIKEADLNVIPVGKDDDVEGVVTARDIAIAAAAEPCNAAETPVEDIVQRVMGFCSEGDDLGHAIERMRSLGVTRLLVRGGEGQVIGVLTMDDILGAVPALKIVDDLQGDGTGNGNRAA